MTRTKAAGPWRGTWTTRPVVPRDVTVGGQHISYCQAGIGAPLLLVHGLGGWSRWWFPLFPELTSNQFRVIAPDLPGFGRSSGPFAGLGSTTRLLASFMDRLALPEFLVCGHSMGGAIAARLAAELGRRVRGLVLIDSAGVPDGVVGRAIKRIAQPWSWCPLHFYPALIGGVLRAGPRNLWSAIRELRRYDIRPTLERVRAPSMVIWGERDTLVPLEHGRIIAAGLSGARMETIRDARHLPMVSDPARVAELVVSFLSEAVRSL